MQQLQNAKYGKRHKRKKTMMERKIKIHSLRVDQDRARDDDVIRFLSYVQNAEKNR